MTFIQSSSSQNGGNRGNYHRFIMRRRGQSCLPVYFFLDVSNILISAQQFLVKQGHAPAEQQAAQRINLEHLVQLACGPRQLAQGYACAGGNRRLDHLRPIYQRYGLEFEYRENVISPSEQSVDLAIRHRMGELECDTLHGEAAPGVVVLATGDGNRQERDSFPQRLERLKKAGHHIELIAWRDSLHHGLQDLVWQLGGDIILLDYYWESVTFTEGGRRSQSLPEWLTGKNGSGTRG